MMYTPHPAWPDATRATINEILGDVDDATRDAIHQVAREIGGHVLRDFPDLDPRIVGWVTMRATTHLLSLTLNRPVITARTLAFVGLLAGQEIEAGAA